MVLFITCSDYRIPPDLLTRIKPDELFVTRTVANIVPPFGTGEMAVGAVVEYAVLHLHVEHCVVMGHTDCGGIKALDHPVDWSREPHIARWIEHARPAKTKVEASGFPEAATGPSSAGSSAELRTGRHLATVRENVLLQLEHLRSYDPVREGERAGELTLHGWVYHLETGEVEAWSPEAEDWTPQETGG
ncbi:carbonic anhydrase [Chloroflexota bacterium]